MAIEVLKNPSYDSFIQLLGNSREEIILCAPYIKKSIVQSILKNKNENAKLKLITKSWLPDFVSKSSDIEAIELLLQNSIEVLNYQRLHAKTYIFDKNKVIVTSGNLTNGGLIHNFEYGVIISDDEIINSILKDYKDMIQNKEACGKFDFTNVKYIKERIKKLPKTQKVIIDEEGESSLLIDNKNQIINSLSSWQKDIFEIIANIENSSFSLKEILQFKDLLSIKHPNNNNIEAKIRQQLQILRDKGLIMFVSKGNYKKIWK